MAPDKLKEFYDHISELPYLTSSLPGTVNMLKRFKSDILGKRSVFIKLMLKMVFHQDI